MPRKDCWRRPYMTTNAKRWVLMRRDENPSLSTDADIAERFLALTLHFKSISAVTQGCVMIHFHYYYHHSLTDFSHIQKIGKAL